MPADDAQTFACAQVMNYADHPGNDAMAKEVCQYASPTAQTVVWRWTGTERFGEDGVNAMQARLAVRMGPLVACRRLIIMRQLHMIYTPAEVEEDGVVWYVQGPPRQVDAYYNLGLDEHYFPRVEGIATVAAGVAGPNGGVVIMEELPGGRGIGEARHVVYLAENARIPVVHPGNWDLLDGRPLPDDCARCERWVRRLLRHCLLNQQVLDLDEDE